nr:hypothetical protein BaRGS_003518 [Batillaria attramentaria]
MMMMMMIDNRASMETTPTIKKKKKKMMMMMMMMICILYFQVFSLPVFILLGLVGSAMGSAVLLGTRLRYKFFSHFLVCLNVASAAFLLTVFLSWLAANGVDVFAVPGLCQIYVFSSHFFTFLTVWHSVLGSYLVLCDWLKPGAFPCLTNPTAAKTAVVALSVFGFTVYSYKTWTYASLVHNGTRTCNVIPENMTAMAVLNVLDLLLLLVVPSVLFLVFVTTVTILLLRPLCRRVDGTKCVATSCVRDRGIIASSSRAPPCDVILSDSSSMLRRYELAARYQEVHGLALSQSACFLLLVTPHAVSSVHVVVLRWVYHQLQTEDDILLHHVFQFPFYLYFAVLPFCPMFSSYKFRAYLCDLLRGKRRATSPRLRRVSVA